ncbi:MAG: histidine phosphatase family protein [Granulosicoccaceae bacterium]
MLRLHIVRHGQTEWNAIRRVQGQQDSQLNDKGRQQAAQVRDALSDIDFKAVFVSPLLRTRQTAEILCRDRSADLQFVDDLKEMGLGEWETLMWEDIHKTWPEQHAQFSLRPHLFNMPSAETAQQVMERGINAIDHIRAQAPEGDVLVVSHGVLIKTIILKYAQQPMSVLWDEPHLENCCRSILQFDSNTGADWLSVADVDIADVKWAL